MSPRLLLLFLLIPVAAGAQAPVGGSFSPAERSALQQLDDEFATQFELIDSWFSGKPIQYYHFGESAGEPAALYRVRGGGEVFSSIPGLPGYSALRQVFDVEVLPAAGVNPATVRSHDQILALVREGKARMNGSVMLNLPIVPAGSTLERDPAARPLREATYRGHPVHYFDFGVNPAAVIPLVAFAQRFPVNGEPLAEVEGQPSNASAVPGPGYSDLWDIQVAVGNGYQPGSYRDVRQVQADVRSGKLQIRSRKVVFNCPVVYVEGRPAARPGPWLPAMLASRVEEPVVTGPGVIETQSAMRPTSPAPAAAAVAAPAPAPAAAPAPVMPAGSRFYSGRSNLLDVSLPKGEAELVLDGVLNEPVWQTAAVLTGFSQYQPQDGIPAADSTEVLVWYSDHAIHFGIRAFEPHGAGAIRAQLADRDKIDADDQIQIFIDSFNDRRRALYFAVNPLGRQSDGVRVERGGGGGGGGITGVAASGLDADLAEDFQFQSKGRVTEWGYEIEVRIPFKSMRYQSMPVQDWGIQVVREVQHSQHVQTWTPARRGGQSFLAQSGRLKGLSGLKRGLVMDLQPEFTSHMDGAPVATPGTGWNYADPKQEIGGNLRWGITTNLTLNGTANPDFSQVEADVQQVQYDPRSAVSFPEKRPFFVEGSEQFDAPHNLIYTRRIVQPVAAVKLNGQAVGANIGLLSAVDQRTPTGIPGDTSNPIVNILRLKRDLGGQSTVGMTYTDRIDGSNWSRVASADARMVFARLYAFTGSYAHAFNQVNGTSFNAPVWRFNLDRTGRRFGLSYNVQGTHPRFATTAGFVNRTDIANASLNHRFIWLGRSGATLESYTLGVNLNTNWWYDSLLSFREPNDPKLHLNNAFVFKGGWRLSANVLLESFRYDPGLYRSYYIERSLGGGARDTVPYVGTPRIQNLDLSLSFATPQFSTFRLTFSSITGRDENFEEWSPAFIFFPTVQLDWVPHSKVRTSFRYPLQLYVRMSDWSTVRRRQIPRLKVEYQATRAIFVRFVGQYDSHFRDSLRDDSRTNFPVLLRNTNGTFRRSVATTTNNFRWDVLFSFQPNPGTVFFAGYGASMREPEPFELTGLSRTVDGFFIKLSYLFRL